MAINRFTGSTSASWGTATNWSQGTVPTSTDGHVTTFDGTSPACTVNVSGSCQSLDMSAYANTITMTNGITMTCLSDGSSVLKFASGMTMAGASGITVNNNGFNVALTSNTFQIPTSLSFTAAVSAAGTHTLVDDFIFPTGSTLALGSTNSTTRTFNGSNFRIRGGTVTSTNNSANNIATGTTNIVFDGAGGTTSAISTSATSVIRLNVTINTSGTVNINSNLNYNTGTFTWTAGTVSTTSSTLAVTVAATTLNTSTGIVWNNVTISGSATITLSSDLYVSGTLTLGATNNATVINGNTIKMTGASFVHSQTTGSVSGTTAVSIENTCTWTSTATSGTFRLATTFNASGKTLTISGGHRWNSVVFTHTAGTITSSSATITVVTTACTITKNVTGSVYPNFTLVAGLTCNGTYGFDMGNLTCVTPGVAISLKDGNTYTAVNLILNGVNGSPVTLSSATASASTTLTMSGTTEVAYVTATDINSTGGTIVYNFDGTITRTSNWYLIPTALKYFTMTDTGLKPVGQVTKV